MCWLCEKSDSSVCKTYMKGLKFHSKCFGAVRAVHRQFRMHAKDPEEAKAALAKDQSEMLSKAGAWRKKVLPYLHDAAARKAVREGAKQEVGHRSFNETTKYRARGSTMMTCCARRHDTSGT